MNNNVMTAKVNYQSIESSNSPEVGDSLVFNADFFNAKQIEKIKNYFRNAQIALSAGGFTSELVVSEELFSVDDDCDWRYDEAMLVVNMNYRKENGDVFACQRLVGKYDSADFIETEPFSLDELIAWVKEHKSKAA